jgi:hypothetical protein
LLDNSRNIVRVHFCGVASEKDTQTSTKGVPMLYTIAVLLVILWLLGMVSSYTLGGFIHILLVLAVISVLIRLIQGRSPIV